MHPIFETQTGTFAVYWVNAVVPVACTATT